MMQIENQEGKVCFLQTTINIGVKEPFRVLHISDTHFTYADEHDDERKHYLMKRRTRIFPCQETSAAFASEYAKREGLPILHTGDLIDFVSHANLERAKAFIEENDCFLAAGNHEFSQYVGEAWEDAAYRNQSLARVQAVFKNDIRFSVREIGGVNFVAIDNSYYLFEKEQLDALKAVEKEGKPMVLMMHTPLYTEALYEARMEVNRRQNPNVPPCAYLMAAPDEKVECYTDHRKRQQKADAPTKEAYDYIVSEPLIKALIVGHLHENIEDAVTQTLTQYMTGDDTVREITFV